MCGMTKGPPRHKETWWWYIDYKSQEFTSDIQSESVRKNCFRIARQMDRDGRDVISMCCMKNERVEMQMIRWMCGIFMKYRRTSVELRRLIGLKW